MVSPVSPFELPGITSCIIYRNTNTQQPNVDIAFMKREDDPIDFRYEGKSPQPDLLNYLNMDLQMSRQASTGTGWLSVIVVAGWASCGIIGLIIFVLVNGH